MRRPCAGLLAALLVAGCGGEPAEAPPSTPAAAVVVWSDATDFPLAQLVEGWTRTSGVPTEIVRDAGEPPARTDLVLTADTGRLWRMNEESGLRPVYSDVLEANAQAALRDPDGMWFGVSWNPLVIVYDTRVIDSVPPDWAALVAERWRGRLCLSSSTRTENRLLLASLIAQDGEPAAERVVRGWVANLAEPPFDSVDDLLTAIASERCRIGIADQGTVARARADAPGLPIAAVVPATDRGAFAIVTAAGVTRHATNPDGGAALLEWLSQPPAQAIVAAESFALPAHGAVAAPRAGPVPATAFDAALASSRLPAAALLAERAGYR